MDEAPPDLDHPFEAPMTRKASIDIGTNSTRLLIADISDVLVITPVFTAERITRLGQGLGESGRLAAAAMDRVIAALIEYQAVIVSHQVSEATVFATSAARDAANQKEFIDLIYRCTGMKVRILDGATEAQLSFLGAVSDQPNPGKILICDIGGGSTEFIFGRQKQIESAHSLDIGSRRLTERFLDEPIQTGQLSALIEFLNNALPHAFPTLTPLDGCLCVGGTATTLAMMVAEIPLEQPERIHNYPLSLDRLTLLNRRLEQLSISQRQKLIGLHPQRADVILAGAMIVESIMRHFRLDHIRVSLRDLLYGIFLEQRLG